MGTQVAIYSYYNCIYHDGWYQPQQAGVLQITTPQNAKQATTKASGKASGKDFRKRKGAWLSAGIRCSTALNMPQDPTTATQTYWASTLLRVLVQWRPLDANAKRFENAIQKRAPKNSQPTSTESFFLPSFLPSHFSSSTFSLPRSSVIFPRNLSVRKCRRRRILWTMCTFTSSWICNAEFLTLTINTTKTNLPMKNTRGGSPAVKKWWFWEWHFSTFECRKVSHTLLPLIEWIFARFFWLLFCYINLMPHWLNLDQDPFFGGQFFSEFFKVLHPKINIFSITCMNSTSFFNFRISM